MITLVRNVVALTTAWSKMATAPFCTVVSKRAVHHGAGTTTAA